MSATSTGFVPPPYPYDRLDRLIPHGGGVRRAAPSTCRSARRSTRRRRRSSPPSPRPGPSAATRRASAPSPLREAVARWIERRFGVAVPIGAIGATIGTKEFVGTLPQWLQLRTPDRDTVLYPAASYPTYEMGAILAGCRPVAVPLTADRRRRPRRRSTRPTPAGRCACGSTARATRPARSTTSAPPRRGAGPTACRCSPTSATSSSRGTGRAAASSSTASTASSPCTRCRSARTSPAAGSASTPATPSSCTTSRRCASTSG